MASNVIGQIRYGRLTVVWKVEQRLWKVKRMIIVVKTIPSEKSYIICLLCITQTIKYFCMNFCSFFLNFIYLHHPNNWKSVESDLKPPRLGHQNQEDGWKWTWLPRNRSIPPSLSCMRSMCLDIKGRVTSVTSDSGHQSWLPENLIANLTTCNTAACFLASHTCWMLSCWLT